MTVSDLIELLKKYPPDMLVARELFSEQVLLEFEDVVTKLLCKARPDGWIQNGRPDLEYIEYLVFKGN